MIPSSISRFTDAVFPVHVTGRQNTWPFRCTRFLYIFLMFLGPALIADPFQQVAMASIFADFGKVKHLFIYPEPLATIVSLNNLLWALCVTFVTSLALSVFDPHMRRFWVIAAAWGLACLLGDVEIHGIAVGLNLNFLIEATSDIAGGIILAAPIRWINEPVAAPTDKRVGSISFDATTMITGYAGLALLWTFWTFALLSPFMMLLLYLVVGDILFMPFEILILAVLSPTLSILAVLLGPLLLYLLALMLLRKATKAVLTFQRMACVAFMILGLLLCAPIYFVIVRYFPAALLSNGCLTFSSLFWLCMLGFFCGALKRNPPLKRRTPRLISPQAFRISRASLVLQKLVPSPIYGSVRAWFQAARRPGRTLERVVNTIEAGDQWKKIWTRAKAAAGLSLFTAAPLFWFLNINIRQSLFRASSYGLIMLAVLFGGVIYHLVFRLFRRPSTFLTTLSVYSVPQLIFAPAISLLSIPLLYQHYLTVEAMRSQRPQLADVPGKIVALLFVPDKSTALSSVSTSLVGIVTVGMQVMFVEAYSYTYGVSRMKSYTPAMLAGFLAALAVQLTTRPVQDLLVYLAGS